MQVTINIPDDLPNNIVQQYINTIEMQMALISKLTSQKPQKSQTASIKRGSAKQQITFIADDFCEPLADFRTIRNESVVRYAYLLWHLADDTRLSKQISGLIENEANNKFLSIVSLWEIELKRNIGKLSITQPIESLLPPEIVILG